MKKVIFQKSNFLLIISFLVLQLVVVPWIGARPNPVFSSEDTSFLGFDSDSYDLLILSPKKFSSDLLPFVKHKQNVGIATRLVTLDEVYDQMYWQGRDKPEKIKYFIKNAFDFWNITYVLLVGDFRLMPIRYVHNADVEGYYEPFFISELYYADIYDANGSFSSWDTNNNGVFGEWIEDNAEDADIDLYPDVYVGRLACANRLEVRIMVSKIISYETSTFGAEWFDRIVVVAGDTYPEVLNANWTGNEGEQNTLQVLENMTEFEATKLWTSDQSFSGPRDVRREINKGCGFLYFDGHGSPFTWSTHPTNDPDTWIDGLNVLSMSRLRNRKMLPVCVVGGCHNLQFDVHLGKLRDDRFFYYTWIPECWGWKLTRAIRGGSIATIGCTGLGMTKEDKDSFSGAGDFLEPSFFHEYDPEENNILGKIWGDTLSLYLDQYPIDWNTPAAWDFAIDAKTVQQWALLGDPSLRIGGYPSAH